MSYAISTTLLGSTVASFASLGKLTAPHFTRAAKTARQALVPVVKMLSTRLEYQGLHCLGGFPCLRAKLDDLRALLPRRAFQGFPENRRYVKFNHFRRTRCNSPTIFIRNYSVVESHNRSLSKSAPQTGHTLQPLDTHHRLC